MIELTTPAAAREWADRVHREGQRIALVPTMGFLHAGHLSLVRLARQRAERCVASIFVNPLQFGAGEDLERYPRDKAGDRAKLAAEGVDMLYAPDAEAMYGPGFQTSVRVKEITAGLCGEGRPGHFEGVTTVVTKLFNAVRPDVAVFGEKDYQQLATIRRLVSDLDLGIEIVGGPIVREADGLAMSSRNAYLSGDEREASRVLSRALGEARRAVRGGEAKSTAVLDRVHSITASEPLVRIEYAEVVDAETLQPVDLIDRSSVLALAAHVGKTRLIDNTVLAAVGE